MWSTGTSTWTEANELISKANSLSDRGAQRNSPGWHCHKSIWIVFKSIFTVFFVILPYLPRQHGQNVVSLYEHMHFMLLTIWNSLDIRNIIDMENLHHQDLKVSIRNLLFLFSPRLYWLCTAGHWLSRWCGPPYERDYRTLSIRFWKQDKYRVV